MYLASFFDTVHLLSNAIFCDLLFFCYAKLCFCTDFFLFKRIFLLEYLLFTR